ncbi:MAG: sulfotransferase domain-containing protein [Pirellulaceae bacterium]|nr:sulfotransferase domain-containing protein [Pirellulaceae bacterium]
MSTTVAASTRLPTFIIIGAQKGGTTSLFRYLATHPEICCSSMKETDFFVTEYERGLEWYSSCFERDAPAIGEASPNYATAFRLPAADVARRIHSVVPNVKLIYVMRDPVERMVSHYWHSVEMDGETRDLATALTAPFEVNGYVRPSCYFEQLQGYRQYFSERQFLLLSSYDLLTRTREVMRQVFEFLEVNPSFRSGRFDQSYHRTADKETFQPTIWEKLYRSWRDNIQTPYLRRWTPRAWRKTRSPHLLSLDRRTKTRLIDWLAPDVRKLRETTGMRFADWCL